MTPGDLTTTKAEPAAAAAVVPPVPPVRPVPAITGDDAETLARAARVEARLPRIARAGVLVGAVCGVAVASPFFAAERYFTLAIAHADRLTWAGVILRFLLTGAMPALAYCAWKVGRAAGRATPGEIEAELRRVRRVVAVSLFLSVAACVTGLARKPMTPELLMTAVYATCAAACVAMAGDVRKALGEFEDAVRRRRQRRTRGFTVALNSPAVSAAGGARAERAAPVNAAPVQMTPASPLARHDTAGLADADAHHDLRRILHLLAVGGVLLYGLRLAGVLSRELRVHYFNATFAKAFKDARGVDAVAMTIAAAGEAAAVFLSLAAAAWVVWGLVVLAYGARARLTALALAWLTLICSAVVTVSGPLLKWVMADRGSAFRLYADELTPRAAEILHALTLCVLLTRPRVAGLFVRGSETADDP